MFHLCDPGSTLLGRKALCLPDLSDLPFVFITETVVDPGDGTGHSTDDKVLIFRTQADFLLKAGHEVSDIEAPDIVHVIGTKGRPVSVGEQDIVFMDVNTFDVVHSRTILSWGCAEQLCHFVSIHKCTTSNIYSQTYVFLLRRPRIRENRKNYVNRPHSSRRLQRRESSAET